MVMATTARSLPTEHSGSSRHAGGPRWRKTTGAVPMMAKASRSPILAGQLSGAEHQRGWLRRTAPAGCFPPNGYGLYDMIGNVWEWTSDWYRSGHPKVRQPIPRAGIGQPSPATRANAERVIKGGSYLCSMNYCSRYRPAARPAPGKRPCGRASGLSYGAQQAEPLTAGVWQVTASLLGEYQPCARFCIAWSSPLQECGRRAEQIACRLLRDLTRT